MLHDRERVRPPYVVDTEWEPSNDDASYHALLAALFGGPDPATADAAERPEA